MMDDAQNIHERLARVESAIADLLAAGWPPLSTPPGDDAPDGSPDEPEPPVVQASSAGLDDSLWAQRQLAELSGRPATQGAVMVAGDMATSAGQSATWQVALPTELIESADWTELAEPLSALGHPVRLAILQAVVLGTDTVKEIGALLGVRTSGQVYHHVNQLRSGGWLRSRSGGHHVVPPERLVPLYAAMLLCLR